MNRKISSLNSKLKSYENVVKEQEEKLKKYKIIVN